MKTGNHSIDFFFADQILRKQLAQEPTAWQFSHLHAVLGNFSFCVKRKTGSALVNRNHCQIHFWTEPAIQLKLALVKVVPLFQGAEIKKPETHGLLHFEDKGRGNEDPRDVCLNRAHFRRPVWIRSRRLQERNQPLL
jgi:hypothetical protein